MKYINIYGGGDWVDASHSLLKINKDITQEELKVWQKEYYSWLRDYWKIDNKFKYKTFTEFLKENGCSELDDNDPFLFIED